MGFVASIIRRFYTSNAALTANEYAVMLAFITCLTIGAGSMLSSKLSKVFKSLDFTGPSAAFASLPGGEVDTNGMIAQ